MRFKTTATKDQHGHRELVCLWHLGGESYHGSSSFGVPGTGHLIFIFSMGISGQCILSSMIKQMYSVFDSLQTVLILVNIIFKLNYV